MNEINSLTQSSSSEEEIQLIKQLANGGEGTIHLAKWQGQTIIVKKPHLVNSPSLTKELHVFKTVIHPKVLNLLGHEPVKGWLLLPLMEKGALSAVMASQKESFPWLQRIQISSDIVDGLRCLHKHEILHCDIKSDNVLIDEKYRAKLADFGTAQIKAHPEWSFPWGGSIAYWAPELIPWIQRLPPSELALCFPEAKKLRGEGKMPPFSEKSDIYALGTLFWEIAEKRKAVSEVYGERKFHSSEEVPFTYQRWIQWCRENESDKRPLASDLFEELSNKETQYKLLEEANRRLTVTQIVFVEEPTFSDLFGELQEIPDIEQWLFKPELPKDKFTERQEELQKEIEALFNTFLLLKKSLSSLKDWQLDFDCLMKNQQYQEEMTGGQRNLLQQLACQYGWWVKKTCQSDIHWQTIEQDLLKSKPLELGEIHLYNKTEFSHTIALLHMGPNSERREYARQLLVLAFLWEALQSTLKTKAHCRFHRVAEQWFQMLANMKELFGNSQDPFIQKSLPLLLQSGSECMQPLISRVHERFILLIDDLKQSSIEAVCDFIQTDLIHWFQFYRSFQKWEWISRLQTEVLQPSLEPYLKKSDQKAFEEITQCFLPWLRGYSCEKELEHLVGKTYNWIRELAINNPKTTHFDTLNFKKQIAIEPTIAKNIKGSTPSLWQILGQKREDYKDPQDYTKEVIETLDSALNFCLPFLGEAPSHWALLGLGSLGRGQLLPYSDLDIALIVEDEEVRKDPYWQRLISLLETLTQLMDNAGYWEEGTYVWLGAHIDAGDKKAMQGDKPFLIQTPSGFAHWVVQSLHKVTKEEREKSTLERLLGFSGLHSCVISSTAKGLFFEYQMELERALKGKMDHTQMVLAWQKEHARDWQRALREDNEFKYGVSIKESVFAPLNYYLLDHELLEKKLEPYWLSILQKARKDAFKLRLTFEQRAKGRILFVKKEGGTREFVKRTPFENKLQLTESEDLLIERLQGIGAVAYNGILNNTTDPFEMSGISLSKMHPSLHEYWTTGLAAALTFGKEHDLKIHRRLYRLMPLQMRIEYLNALKRYSKIASNAKLLLKRILPGVPLPNGNRGNFRTRQEKWQKIIVSLVEPCDLQKIPQGTTGALMSWVENGQTRHGILKDEFAKQLLDKKGGFRQDKKLTDGRRSVIPLYDDKKNLIVYPKAYPELPGRQLASDCLAYRMTGSSVQASLVLFTPVQNGKLNEKTAYPVLLSKPAGVTIQDIVRTKEFTKKLSLYHFTLKVLSTYILGLEDDKKDNVTLNPAVDEMGKPCSQLISIDSDHVFSSPMADTTTDSKVLLKTVTFMFPEMNQPLDPEAVADFLSLNKEEVLEQWLSECRYLNSSLIGNLKNKRQGLFKPEMIQKWAPIDKWSNSDSFSFIPIAFEPGTIADIYQRWGRVEHALKAKRLPANHFNLLQQVSPRLTHTYQKIFNEHFTVSKRFDVLAELYTDYKMTKEKGEISHTSTHQVNISKTLVGVKKFQEALMQGKIFDASGPFGVKELEEIQMHYKYLNDLKNVFAVGLDVDDKEQQAVIKTLEILISKPYYSALIERVIAQVRFHYTETNKERLFSFQDKLLNLLSQKSLQHLTLVGWQALSEEKFTKLIEKSSDLQSLSLIECPNFKCSGAAWAKLSTTCPQLKKIRMAGISEMPLSWWFTEIKFEKLQSLHLEDCNELTVYQINAPQLQQLTLKNCNNLIKVNLSGQPIERLRFNQCPQLADGGLFHDMQGQHLKSISIQKCENIRSSNVYIQWPFLIGQMGNYYYESELIKIELILQGLKLHPHEIPAAASFVLKQCDKTRLNLNDFQPTILEIIDNRNLIHSNAKFAFFFTNKERCQMNNDFSSLLKEKKLDDFLFLLELELKLLLNFHIKYGQALGKLALFLPHEERHKACGSLLLFLKDEVSGVRSIIAQALAKLAFALSQKERSEVSITLLTLLKNKDYRIRSSNAKALGELAPFLSQEERREVYNALLLLLQDIESIVCVSSIKALEKVAPFLSQKKRRTLSNALLLLLKDKNPFVCIRSARCLGTLDPSLSQEKRGDIYSVLLSFLKHEEWLVRVSSAKALGKLDLSLLQAERGELINTLLTLLKNKDPNVRSGSAEALGELAVSLPKEERRGVCNSLLPLLKDKEWFVCISSAKSLEKLDSSLSQEEQGELRNTLLTLLKHKDPNVRIKCVEALVKLAPSLSRVERGEIYGVLLSLSKEKDSNIQIRSAKCRGELAPFLYPAALGKVFHVILSLLNNENLDVCSSAEKALEHIIKNFSISYGIKREIPQLRELLNHPLSSPSSTLPVERKEKLELIDKQTGPFWYSDGELEQLLRLQLQLKTNRDVYLWAEAANIRQLETQIMYACSASVSENPAISVIPIFLNAKENAFYEAGNHWAILILASIPSQNEKLRQLAIYQNPMGVEIPDSISQLLKGWELFDMQVKQQTNDNDCGPWIVYTAQRIVEALQESFPLVPGKEGLQKSIIALRKEQGEELRQFYHKQLQERLQPSLPLNQDDPEKEDIDT